MRHKMALSYRNLLKCNKNIMFLDYVAIVTRNVSFFYGRRIGYYVKSKMGIMSIFHELK